MFAVAILSFLPSHDKALLHTKGRFHAWGHAGAFALISFVMIRSVRSPGAKALMFVAAVALGCAIEYTQHVIYHQSVESLDILVDWIGILFGAMLTTLGSAREG